MATTSTNLNREWNENYKLVLWIIHRRLRQKLGRYDDELVQEALVQAWDQYAKCRQRVADPVHAIALVARSGVGRALRGSRFVKRERGYLDALDVRGKTALDRLAARGEKLRHPADRGFLDPGEIAARPENLPVDSLDRDPVESMIRRLPESVRAIARLLSFGCPRKLICERLGISAATLSGRVDMIMVFVRAMLNERKAGG
jgi:DNA-directed RNA polymerase specialized sigma24 family protein